MASSYAAMDNQLFAVFDRCLAMQADHLAGLQAGGLAKIDQWLEERQAMMARLQQSLADRQAAGLDEELRVLVLEKLRCILNTEKVLFALAEQQRSALSEQLSGIRRGKLALGRYGATGKHHRLQFVSDKG